MSVAGQTEKAALPMPPADQMEPPTRTTKALAVMVWAFIGVVVLWLALGAVSMTWLALAVPLTEQDIAWASWLPSPSVALHLSGGALGSVLGLAVGLFGIALAVANRSAVPLVLGLAFALATNQGLREASVVRVGILDDVIKVGCFVPETHECKQMLGLSRPGEFRIYPVREPRTDSPAYTRQYSERRSEVVSEPQVKRAMLHSMPFGAWLRAPVYLGAADQLKAKLEAQRAQVIDLKLADAAEAR